MRAGAGGRVQVRVRVCACMRAGVMYYLYIYYIIRTRARLDGEKRGYKAQNGAGWVSGQVGAKSGAEGDFRRLVRF